MKFTFNSNEISREANKVNRIVFQTKVQDCEKCQSSSVPSVQSPIMGPLSPESEESHQIERIRELELELAQTKLAHVEAECRNQDLIHQLNSTVTELNTSKHTWPPWLSKTLSSIKEVANKKDLPSFYSIGGHQSNITNSSAPSFISHINTNRDSFKNDAFSNFERRESAPVLKDSQSYNNFRTHN